MLGTKSVKRSIRRLAGLPQDRDGASAVEFAFLLPVLLGFSFGMIDISLYLFDYHRAGEATRQGTRAATIEPAIVDPDTLNPGQKSTCTSSGGVVSCSLGTESVTANTSYANILTRMQVIRPDVTEANVTVDYQLSDIGDVATPGGVLPLVTVNLVDPPHDLTMLSALPGMPTSIKMPTFSTTILGNGKVVSLPVAP